MRYFTNILLNTENNARKYFERYPFTHAFLAGVGVIFFWRGAWEIADILGVGPITSVVVGSLMLGAIGLFVQTFVGNAIIIKNVAKEEKSELKTKQDVTLVGKELKEEEVTLSMLARKIERIEAKLDSMTNP